MNPIGRHHVGGQSHHGPSRTLYCIGAQLAFFFILIQILLSLNQCSLPWTARFISSEIEQRSLQQTFSLSSSKSSSTKRRTHTIPLVDLVNTKLEDSRCANGLVFVNDTILDPKLAYDPGVYSSSDNTSLRRRRIPRIVHVTSKTRCMAPEFARNLEAWRFANHSFFFHNEEAVERLLLDRDWPEFPALRHAVRCTKGGAGLADVWRALVVWEYGGIYTDIDNMPVLFDGETIQNDDEAFFIIERSAILSQFFFASRPRHPLMYLLVQHMTNRLLALNDVSMQTVALVTGPGALREAFCNFLGGQGPNFPRHVPTAQCWYLHSGVYTGLMNTTVRAVGHEDNPDEYVARDVILDKHLIYLRMNMTYFREIPKVQSKQSCVQRIYEGRDLFRESTAFDRELMRRGEPPFYR
jgi:mannosyltransferase OCH1-like enzyme